MVARVVFVARGTGSLESTTDYGFDSCATTNGGDDIRYWDCDILGGLGDVAEGRRVGFGGGVGGGREIDGIRDNGVRRVLDEV